MKEEFEEGRDPEIWPARSYSIDERFDFSVPHDIDSPDRSEDTAAASTPKRGVGETAPTPPGEEPGFGPDSWKADTSEDPLVGRMVGNFQVLSILGRGGFGTVYKARDTNLDRMVALKFLRFPLDPEYRKLFSREAKVLANLSKHPSIVQIYTWDEYQGSYYFALEYLDYSAESLLERSGGRLPVRRALEITAECAAALEYAHQQGVLHRDIKPANILIDQKTNRAKLCDFGLARFHNLGTGTASAYIAGSPPYMAPEQIAGDAVDPRTDVYALGVTLYELLSGRVPFEGSTQAEIFQRIRKRKATPLGRHRGDLPPSVVQLVARATAWRPDDRFQTAEEFHQALKSTLDRLETSGTPEPQARERRSRMLSGNRGLRITAALVIAFITVGGLVALVPRINTGGAPGELLSGFPIAVAEATELLDEGNYTQARSALETYLQEHPEDDFGRYALGYANYLLGDVDAAQAAFGAVKDEGLRTEGLAAVAYARESDGARPTLQEALDLAPTQYPALLLASLDILKGDYTAALARLEDVDAARFYFDWQRRQFHRMFGQAYFKMGALDDAERYFARLPEDDPVAAGYLKLAREKQEARNEESRRQRIEDLRQYWDSLDAAERQDTWTSRPFTCALMPADAMPTRAAMEIALPDLLPVGLTEALKRMTRRPVELVNRENIDAIIQEMSLSSQLGSEESLQVRRLIGARFLIKVAYLTAGTKDWVQVVVMDAETSGEVLRDTVAINEMDDYRTVATRIAARLQEAVTGQYPIQAKVTAQDGQAVLNVGESVGLQPGMAFNLRSSPKAPPLGDVRAIVTDRIGDAQAIVDLERADVEDLPPEGLYAREERV